MCYDYHSGFALEILAINNPRIIIIIIIITTISKVSSRCSPSRISRKGEDRARTTFPRRRAAIERSIRLSRC